MAMASTLLVAGAAGVGALILCGFAYRQVMSWWWGRHDARPGKEQDVRGKVVLITGANCGLGMQAAYEMYKRGAIVVMACRDLESTKSAAVEIERKVKGSAGGELVIMKLDLASFDSVRQFAKEFRSKFHRIHILINNAGIYIPFKKSKSLKTVDGHEMHFQVNHLSHFLLTLLLIKEIKSGGSSRIVHVTSALYLKSSLKMDDLNLEHVQPNSKNRMLPYCNSKFANVLFNHELARRCPAGSGVCSYAVSPGWVFTSLSRNSDLKWYQYVFFTPIAFLFKRSVEQGCQTILHCALSRECASESGKMYRNCRLWENENNQVNDELAKKLWTISEQIAGAKLEEASESQ